MIINRIDLTKQVDADLGVASVVFTPCCLLRFSVIRPAVLTFEYYSNRVDTEHNKQQCMHISYLQTMTMCCCTTISVKEQIYESMYVQV